MQRTESRNRNDVETDRKQCPREAFINCFKVHCWMDLTQNREAMAWLQHFMMKGKERRHLVRLAAHE